MTGVLDLAYSSSGLHGPGQVVSRSPRAVFFGTCLDAASLLAAGLGYIIPLMTLGV